MQTNPTEREIIPLKCWKNFDCIRCHLFLQYWYYIESNPIEVQRKPPTSLWTKTLIQTRSRSMPK